MHLVKVFRLKFVQKLSVLYPIFWYDYSCTYLLIGVAVVDFDK